MAPNRSGPRRCVYSSHAALVGQRRCMTALPAFSPARLWAIVIKEFAQMRRDRLTFAMVLGIPLVQLILFGFAINTDPKHLPTAVLMADHGPHGRALLYALRNSEYFRFVRE